MLEYVFIVYEKTYIPKIKENISNNKQKNNNEREEVLVTQIQEIEKRYSRERESHLSEVIRERGEVRKITKEHKQKLNVLSTEFDKLKEENLS